MIVAMSDDVEAPAITSSHEFRLPRFTSFGFAKRTSNPIIVIVYLRVETSSVGRCRVTACRTEHGVGAYASRCKKSLLNPISRRWLATALAIRSGAKSGFLATCEAQPDR
jgi:hypothetical protein